LSICNDNHQLTAFSISGYNLRLIMKPTDVGVVIILIVAVTALVFAITRARFEQGTNRVPLNEIAQNVGRDFRQLFGGIISLFGIIM
jgi:hypothetical protein